MTPEIAVTLTWALRASLEDVRAVLACAGLEDFTEELWRTKS
jgi:hypothetical protein